MSPHTLAFKAGYAEIDITPKKGDKMLLVGGGEGVVDLIGDPLYVKTIVLTDGERQVALVSLDLIDLRESDFSVLSKHIKDVQGFDHVLISVTHTHGGYFGDDLLDNLHQKIIQSVDAAKSSMQTVKIGAASTLVDESYNRRVNVDASVEMLWTNPKREPNRPVDQSLEIVHLVDEDNKPFVTLLNYSAHPVITMDLDNVVVSADYPGQLCDIMDKNIGGHTMFFMGAAGDVNPYHANTRPLKKAQEISTQMAAKLATAAQLSIENISKFSETGDFKFETVSFKDPTAEIGLFVLTPNISFASFPGEYFDELGRTLKENSPTEHTFFVGKSNGQLGYVPTSKDTKRGGYGAELADIRVKSDTGEAHIDMAIKHLNTLLNKK